MQILSREESDDFSPFDLSNVPKFNKKTDRIELSIKSFGIANRYLSAAKMLNDKNILYYLPVILTNVSFACELYLKAMLFGYNIDFGNTHGLNDLFKLLPDGLQNYISQNISIKNREKEFHLCLAEQNNAFVIYRYINEAKCITANPVFLFAFAHILQFSYKQLARINQPAKG